MYSDLDVSRFWCKVDKRSDDECWPWLGNLYEGYGSFGISGKGMKAHRASMILNGHNVPPKMHVDHMCRNRACVNPAHLRIVDLKTNTLENSNSVTAINSAKTHCLRGHEFDVQNTRWKGSTRVCRKCMAIHRKQQAERKRNAEK